MTRLLLYSATVCPYAQRSRLALLEKSLDFDLREIDLSDPPADFLRLSPYRKVPLLVHGGERVWESSVINEYLEEVYPRPALMPPGAPGRAAVRIWVDYANQFFAPAFYKLLLAQDGAQQQLLATRLLDCLRYLEQGLAEAGGEHWVGPGPTLADLALYPFFERFCVLNHYRNFHVPASCPRLLAWFDGMRRRESVRRTGNPAAFYIERYARYADGSADSDTAREMREA